MTGFLSTHFGSLLTTLAVSMVPVAELRFGIPYGVAAGLAPWEAFFAAVVGNMLPVPFIILLIRRVFDWLRAHRWWGGKIAWLERKAHVKGRLVRKYRLAGLCVLVAIPLPGTGAWTGALVAGMLGIRLRCALPAIFLGVLIAGTIVTVLTCGAVSILA